MPSSFSYQSAFSGNKSTQWTFEVPIDLDAIPNTTDDRPHQEPSSRISPLECRPELTTKLNKATKHAKSYIQKLQLELDDLINKGKGNE